MNVQRRENMCVYVDVDRIVTLVLSPDVIVSGESGGGGRKRGDEV